MFGNGQNRAFTGCQGRGFAVTPAIDPDHHLLAAFNADNAPCIGFHKRAFHHALFHRNHRAAHRLDAMKLDKGCFFQLGHFPLDLERSIKNITIFEKVCFISHDLLHPE